jgi:hypothetical protein
MIIDTSDEAGFVRIGELHFLRVDRPLPCRSALSFLKNKAGPVIHRDLLWLLRHGIADWFECDPQLVSDVDRTLQAVEMKVEGNETGPMYRGEGRRQNLERQTTGLARSDFEQRVSLFGRRFFLHENKSGTVAFMNRARPFHRHALAETIKRHAIVSAPLNTPDAKPLAKSPARRRGKFTWAPVVAIAGLKIIRIKKPFFHQFPPQLMLSVKK